MRLNFQNLTIEEQETVLNLFAGTVLAHVRAGNSMGIHENMVRTCYDWELKRMIDGGATNRRGLRKVKEKNNE